MPRDLNVHRAIAQAETVLPGPASGSSNNTRWEAIIAVGEFIETDPIPVCDFAMKWARRRGRDLQSAIYCCLIEHLLERHFDLVFPRMREAARCDARVAEHFLNWRTHWLFGQARLPEKVNRLKRLAYELRRLHAGSVAKR
jgi:hypothetical protein